MKIKLLCSGCSSKLTAKEKLFGKTVKCPKCGAPIEVPRPKKDGSALNTTFPASTTKQTQQSVPLVSRASTRLAEPSPNPNRAKKKPLASTSCGCSQLSAFRCCWLSAESDYGLRLDSVPTQKRTATPRATSTLSQTRFPSKQKIQPQRFATTT